MTSTDLETSRERAREADRTARRIGEELTRRMRPLVDGVAAGAEDPLLRAMLGAELSELVRRVGWNSLAVNPGSTSTKVAVFNGLTLAAQDEVRHPPDEPAGVDERPRHIERFSVVCTPPAHPVL